MLGQMKYQDAYGTAAMDNLYTVGIAALGAQVMSGSLDIGSLPATAIAMGGLTLVSTSVSDLLFPKLKSVYDYSQGDYSEVVARAAVAAGTAAGLMMLINGSALDASLLVPAGITAAASLGSDVLTKMTLEKMATAPAQ